MCGRMTLTLDFEDMQDILKEIYNVTVYPEKTTPRYNIAPSQPLLSVIEAPTQERRSGYLKWGFKPSWSDSSFRPLINSRSETVAEKPFFKNAFQHKRCIILADSFYEWDAHHGKQAYRFMTTDQKLMPMAGIYTTYTDANLEKIYGCSILTCPPNTLMAPIHHRMPVILRPHAINLWLNQDTQEPALKALLHPYPADMMSAYPVSSYVNSVAHDSPECIANTTNINP